MSPVRILAILFTVGVLGASIDAMLSYWLDPLRPSRLEKLGVVASYDTGALRFSKPMRASDAEEIHDEFLARLKRQDILARAEPGAGTMLIEASAVFLRVLMGPFFIIAVIGSVIYIRLAMRRAREMHH